MFSTLSVDLCTVHQNRSCINTASCISNNWFSFCDPVLHHRFYIKQLVLSFSLSPNMYGTSEPVPYYTTGSISNNWFSLCDRSPITPPVLYSTTGSLSLCPLVCTVNQNRSCITPPVLFQITGFQFVNAPYYTTSSMLNNRFSLLFLPPNMYGTS